MAANKKPKPSAQQKRNDDRPNRKAFKQRPTTPCSAAGHPCRNHPGRTTGGYTDAKIAARAAKRRAISALTALV